MCKQDVKGVSQFDGSFNWEHAMKPRELVALWICFDQWVASRSMVCDALLENKEAMSQLRSRWIYSAFQIQSENVLLTDNYFWKQNHIGKILKSIT